MLLKLNRIRSRISSNHLQTLILAVAVLITLLSSLPYFNLILNEQIVLLLFFFVLVWMFRVPFRYIFAVCLALIVFSVVLLLFSQEGLAERFGNYAYLFFFVGLLHMIVEHIRNK